MLHNERPGNANVVTFQKHDFLCMAVLVKLVFHGFIFVLFV